MFEEMLPEDKKYLEDILTLFKVTNYKLSETPTRFKCQEKKKNRIGSI